MAWKLYQGEQLTYFSIPEWEQAGIEIGFSTRGGGISRGPFNSLNLGLHVGDDGRAVLENRRRWLSEWKCGWDGFVVGEQVHGNRVAWVAEEEGGCGAQELATSVRGVDGLLTTGNIGLMAFFADCVPLFFYHPKIELVALAHAGWKGTVDKIAQVTVDNIAQAGGSPEDCWVGIGPSIGPCCYEVDDAVAARITANFAATEFLTASRPGHYQLDLGQANKDILLARGVRAENIWLAQLCTSCRADDFFSHRRDGVLTGRMAGWIRRAMPAASRCRRG